MKLKAQTFSTQPTMKVKQLDSGHETIFSNDFKIFFSIAKIARFQEIE